jgi:hypothetical protein
LVPDGWHMVLNPSSIFPSRELHGRTKAFIQTPSLLNKQTLSVFGLESKGPNVGGGMGVIPREACFLFRNVMELKGNP